MAATDGVPGAGSARRAFPEGFVWGSATSAYQVEGGAAEGGRTPSIWDTFCRTPGKVVGGANGDIACDQYHRYGDDVRLMTGLGLAAYRFSIAWPRIQPDGTGRPSEDGLDYYDRLVDSLLAAGICPAATLYHWDLPQRLEDAGGWPARATAERFAEYAAIVADRLGDRVRTWFTINEPWCVAFLGYSAGVHAPGRTNAPDAFPATHHLLLGHGLAARAIRAAVPQAEVSIALNVAVVHPRSDDPADLDAARRIDGLANRIFLGPIAGKGYPEDVQRDVAALTDFGFVHEGDLATIAEPIDLIGINFYQPVTVAAYRPGDERGAFDGHGAHDGGAWPGAVDVQFPEASGPRTAMGWVVDPAALRELLVRVDRDLPGLPIAVTENGAAYDDVPGADGSIDDPARTTYLRGHLGAILDAIDDGANVQGYYVWSLLDNFEWAWGYTRRFGVVHVDFETLERTVKSSGRFLGEVARSNGL
jgi:beta-glucosidase